MEYSNETALVLAGKFNRGCKAANKLETKIINETETEKWQRLEKLIEKLIANPSSDEIIRAIQNTAELYKKLIITEIKVQNESSKEFMNYLTLILFYIGVSRKDHQMLMSLIKIMPKNLFESHVDQIFNSELYSEQQKHFLIVLLAHDFFAKILSSESSVEDTKILINVLSKINSDMKNTFEKILVSFDRNLIVGSVGMCDKYLMIAKQFYEIKISDRFIAKLLCIGLSVDLSTLENLKYQQTKVVDENIIDRIFNALIFLSKVTQNKEVHAACLLAAKACASESMIESHMQNEKKWREFKNDWKVLNDEFEDEILNQLEYFSYAVNRNVSLYNLNDNKNKLSYESLNFLKDDVAKEDLEEMENYPSVERFIKKSRKVLDDEEIDEKNISVKHSEPTFEEVDSFNETISHRFMNIKARFDHVNSLPMEKNEIPEASKDEGLKIKSEIEEISTSPKKFCFNYDLSVDNNNKKSDDIEYFDISQFNNCENSLYDIENAMFYFLLLKKYQHEPEEFSKLNMNRNWQEKKDPKHAAINYLIYRPIPEFSRSMRNLNVTNASRTLLDFLVNTYEFDATPGAYKYIRIHNLYSNNAHNNSEESPKSEDDIKQKNSRRKVAKTSRPSKRKSSDVTSEIESQAIIEIQELPKNEPLIKKIKPSRPPKIKSMKISDELRNIFKILESSFNAISGEGINFDFSQIYDEQSETELELLNEDKMPSFIQFKVKTLRNGRTDLKSDEKIFVPCEIEGSIELLTNIRDEVVYDEKNEPKIKTSTYTTVTLANITIFNTSKFIKNFIIPIIVNDRVHKFKCTFNKKTNRQPVKPSIITTEIDFDDEVPVSHVGKKTVIDELKSNNSNSSQAEEQFLTFIATQQREANSTIDSINSDDGENQDQIIENDVKLKSKCEVYVLDCMKKSKSLKNKNENEESKLPSNYSFLNPKTIEFDIGYDFGDVNFCDEIEIDESTEDVEINETAESAKEISSEDVEIIESEEKDALKLDGEVEIEDAIIIDLSGED